MRLEERWRSVSVGNRFCGSKEVSNLGGVPGGSSGSGGDTSSGETICDGLQGGGSGGLNFSDHGKHQPVKRVSGLYVRVGHHSTTVLRVGTPTQSGSPGFGCGESRFGSFRDEFSFTLGHQSENSDGESVHVGTVTADEVDLGVLETQ